MAHILCNPANVPIAVAVSLLSVIFEIQALEIPSVADAYSQYIKNNPKKKYKFVLMVIPIYTITNNISPITKIDLSPNLSARMPKGNANKA